MRRISTFTIDKESFDDMIKAGRFNQCLEITFRDRTGKYTHKLSAGGSDVLDVYREGLETYVLSSHCGLGYMGLEIFEGSERIGQMFVEALEVKKTLGGKNLAPFTIIKKLRRFIY